MAGESEARPYVYTRWEQFTIADGLPDETGAGGQAIWKASWCELIDGVANWADVFAALKSVGYDGWLAFEDLSTDRTTEEKLTDGLAGLKAFEASA